MYNQIKRSNLQKKKKLMRKTEPDESQVREAYKKRYLMSHKFEQLDFRVDHTTDLGQISIETADLVATLNTKLLDLVYISLFWKNPFSSFQKTHLLLENSNGRRVPSKLLAQLNLSNNRLSGFLPTSLVNFSGLKILLLNGNKISGEVPLEIGGLKSVLKLDMSRNSLSGGIPPEISHCSSLTYLCGVEQSDGVCVCFCR